MNDSETQTPDDRKVRLVLDLPFSLVRRLKAIAKKQGTTVGFVISVMLEKGTQSCLGKRKARDRAFPETDQAAARVMENMADEDWES